MALDEQVKKGGPYTKKEQEDRRQEVFKLHFEKGYSAIKTSELLNVNRNTVNEDIRYWYSELVQELNYDVVTWAIEQIHTFESQKNRLLELLEKEESTQNKIAIEKIIFQINDKRSQFISKMFSNNTMPNPKTDDEIIETIKDHVRYLLLSTNKMFSKFWSKADLLIGIMKRYKCNLAYANTLFVVMEKLGLDACKQISTIPSSNIIRYNILEFATRRGFLSNKEITQISKRVYFDLGEANAKMYVSKTNVLK